MKVRRKHWVRSKIAEVEGSQIDNFALDDFGKRSQTVDFGTGRDHTVKMEQLLRYMLQKG